MLVELLALHLRQYACRLFPAHHGDPRIRPRPQKARTVRSPAHSVIARAEAAADDDRELGHARAGDRGHHFRAVLGDAAGFIFAAHHEPGDVLQENERHVTLAAELDEVRAFECRFREQNAVAGDDPDELPFDARVAAHQRLAVARPEFVELAGVDDARNDLANVEGRASALRHDTVELGRIVDGGTAGVARGGRSAAVEVGHDAAHARQCVVIVIGEVVGDAGHACMHIGAAEIFSADLFARRRSDQRRSREKDRALVADDDGLVGHRRHVRAAGGARAHHAGDLRHAGGGHVRLVVENPPEMIAVGKHFVLARQMRAARVDEIDARQAILECDFLRAQMLLHGQREVGAAFHGRIVGDDHAAHAVYCRDAGDQARCGNLPVVHGPRRERRKLEKRGVAIEQFRDALAHRQLSPRGVARLRSGTAPGPDLVDTLFQLCDACTHRVRCAAELRAGRVELRLKG